MDETQKQILVVEDDLFLSSLLKTRLEREGGFKVVIAQSGTEVMSVLQQIVPNLIILDLILPGESGFEVLEEMRAQPGMNVPVIILSNLGQDIDIERGKALGATEYFVKAKLSIDDLILKIKEFAV